MNDTLPLVGAPVDRVDGRRKVTGTAPYAAEYPLAGLVYAVIITATIGKGRITSIDTRDAAHVPGVIAIMTHENAPRVDREMAKEQTAQVLPLLQDDVIRYDRQPVAVAIADTFEHAVDAASRVIVHYAPEQPAIAFERGDRYAPKEIHGEPGAFSKGNPEAAIAASAVRIDTIYTTPVYHHNPMEPHATTAVWSSDGSLTVYDATQGVDTDARTYAHHFGIPVSHVHVIAKFIGGGFGCKGTTWSHAVLSAMAAKLTGRPVRLVLTRPQMFSSVGFRPQTHQRVALGAGSDGRLNGQIHTATTQTSTFAEFVEPSAMISQVLYPPANFAISHELVRLNTATPTFMRAPGESTGSFALESAMDELAVALALDPVELRLRNDVATDAHGLPFSSRSLRACLTQAADRFDWKRRTPQPRSMRAGDQLVGLGMAAATYPAHRSAASALVRIAADGSVTVQSAGVDLGTGAYTAFSQVAADLLGVPLAGVRMELGDNQFPAAPVAGGSQLTASVGSAVKLAALDARAKLLALVADDPASPLHGVAADTIQTRNGGLYADGGRGESYAAILGRHGLANIEGRADAKPGAEQKTYAMHAFGAHFVELHVDDSLGTIQVRRIVSAFASGRILNAKTATSQYYGGITFGIGMALLEQTHFDDRTARIMNANLGEYLVPTNADVPPIEVIIVPEEDTIVNEIGVKGIGEIGIVGVAAAIANAVYHATGRRVRDLPITPEKLLLA
jgi:xanthine dehydrogenase YagR molybdenum-binding subunit